jgi:hypothetical protein
VDVAGGSQETIEACAGGAIRLEGIRFKRLAAKNYSERGAFLGWSLVYMAEFDGPNVGRYRRRLERLRRHLREAV